VSLMYHDGGDVGRGRHLWRGCNSRSGQEMAHPAALVSAVVGEDDPCGVRRRRSGWTVIAESPRVGAGGYNSDSAEFSCSGHQLELCNNADRTCPH